MGIIKKGKKGNDLFKEGQLRRSSLVLDYNHDFKRKSLPSVQSPLSCVWWKCLRRESWPCTDNWGNHLDGHLYCISNLTILLYWRRSPQLPVWEDHITRMLPCGSMTQTIIQILYLKCFFFFPCLHIQKCIHTFNAYSDHVLSRSQ